MPPDALLGAEARRLATAAIAAIEAQTSAEVVVTLRRQSGDYAAADRLAGALAAFVCLLVLLFHPHPFAVATMPVDVIIAFAIGLFASARSAAVRRALTSAATRARLVATAARAAFVDQGVARTAQRTGLLVYVSLLERAVEVVADAGVDPAALGPAWTAALAALQAAVARGDVDAFHAALVTLGPPLAQALPRRADDRDELADTMEAS
jgi:putative membrane protein